MKADKDARGQTIVVDEAKEAKKKKKIKDTKIEKLDDALVQEYEETLAKIDNYGGDELGELIKKYDIKGPTTGAELDPPKAFNLGHLLHRAHKRMKDRTIPAIQWLQRQTANE